jgi:hypothetical protein
LKISFLFECFNYYCNHEDDYEVFKDEFGYYYDLIESLIHFYPKRSLELIISEVKEAILSKDYERGCIILKKSREFRKYSLIALEEYVKEGIIDFLFNMFAIEDLRDITFEIFAFLAKDLKKLEMFEELKTILKEFMKSIRLSPSLVPMKFLGVTLIEITETKPFMELSDIDFNEIFNFISKSDDSLLFQVSSQFLQLPIEFNRQLLDIVFDQLFVILNSDQLWNMHYPFLFFENIINSMKLEFKPWMPQTIKLVVLRINELLNVDSDINDDELRAFTILNTLITLFKEDCEIYVSKYKVVESMLIFIDQKFHIKGVRDYFEFKSSRLID